MKKYIILFIVFLCLSCKTKNITEIVLIPKGFTGKVVVIFNQNYENMKILDKGERVYLIPEDGILLSKFRKEKANYKTHYFFVDSLGNKTPIESLREVKRTTVKIYNEEFGVMGNSDDKKSLRYFGFYVSSLDSLESFFKSDYENDYNKQIMKKTGYNF
ncbi:DUF6843 domain-containing protein [Chryseobacterium rhizosphaerae]|nr:hypothetical protein [Chryseobacterium rhizosphaerae]GEN67715.1 hypothetical protein CRH01_22830 [Chryseobacterium rhizosphaerae]